MGAEPALSVPWPDKSIVRTRSVGYIVQLFRNTLSYELRFSLMTKRTAPRASMRDVAREAHVSLGSVSRVLSGETDKFAAATVKRVQDTARQLNYRPNAAARSIFTGRSKMAGVMIPATAYYCPMLNTLNAMLFAQGHVMIHTWNPAAITAADDPTEQQIVHQMIERAVDGVILRPSCEEFEHSYYQEIWQRGVPLIVIDREMSLFKTDFVGTDDIALGEAAARYLLELGHRHLLFVGANSACSTSALRGQGFRNVISQTPDASCRAVSSQEIPQVLSQDDSPTGVFCYSDGKAKKCLAEAEKIGLQAPRDFSIIGCGNLPSNTTLTTFDQQQDEIGRRVAELYLKRIAESTRTSPETIRLPARLIPRGTTAART
ncbi:MAG TPA: hypothetical protein DCR55_00695 [Lentisphaeria bacterium]|nr:hypothetical protein [Lentisphaeria bacterium]